MWSDAADDGLHVVKSTCHAPRGKDISSDEGQPVGSRQSLRMASNSRNQVSLCQCVLYHSAPRRTRRSNNRYLHLSTPLAPITMIRIASAIRRLW